VENSSYQGDQSLNIIFQAGTTLQQLTSTTEALTFQSVALLVIFAFLSILPVLLKNR
jgi:hypothetical protein